MCALKQKGRDQVNHESNIYECSFITLGTTRIKILCCLSTQILQSINIFLLHKSYLGRLVGFPHFSIQNFRGPFEPRSAANPSYGILEVPVTNCRSRNLRSLSNLSIAIQNHWMTGYESWYPERYSVCFRQSWMSISIVPAITNSNSRASNTLTKRESITS